MSLSNPIFIFLSVLNVSNYKIFRPEDSDFTAILRTTTITEKNLLLPGVTIREFNEKPEDILRPLFDAIWQAAGYRKSINYDENGKYQRR